MTAPTGAIASATASAFFTIGAQASYQNSCNGLLSNMYKHFNHWKVIQML